MRLRGPRVPDPAEIRTRRLDVTRALLEELGPVRADQLTTRAVREAAGVTAPTLHDHVGDEDGRVRVGADGVMALVGRNEPPTRVTAVRAVLRDAVLGAPVLALRMLLLVAGFAADGVAQPILPGATGRGVERGPVEPPVAGAAFAPDTARARGATLAATGGLILLGAAGAQVLRTPEAWPRTAGGFGRRVADQTGFYVVQTGTQRALAAGLGWRADEAPCARRAPLPLATCAVARTFTAVDGRGVRRPPVPFVASVVAATAASVLWRPERRDAAKARAFVATRLGVVFAGYAGERLLVEWRRDRAPR